MLGREGIPMLVRSIIIALDIVKTPFVTGLRRFLGEMRPEGKVPDLRRFNHVILSIATTLTPNSLAWTDGGGGSAPLSQAALSIFEETAHAATLPS
jgi:hypothetical protein